MIEQPYQMCEGNKLQSRIFPVLIEANVLIKVFFKRFLRC